MGERGKESETKGRETLEKSKTKVQRNKEIDKERNREGQRDRA